MWVDLRGDGAIVLSLKFCENRLRGFGDPGRGGGRKSLISITLAGRLSSVQAAMNI